MEKPKIIEEASLWLEGFRMFGRYWRPWAKEGLWFFLVLALLNIILVIDAHEVGLGDMGLNHRELTPEEAAKAAPIFLTGLLGGFVVGLVQTYIFSIFFLRREPIVRTPKPSWRSFFLFCGVNLQMILLVLGIAASGSIIIAIAGMLRPVMPGYVADGVMLGVVLGSVGLIYYIMIRIVPALAFAASGIRSPLMASWHLMDGNWWRFFGNLLIMVLFSSVLLLIVISVATPINQAFAGKGSGYLLGGVIISVMNALIQVVMTGVFTTFLCAACRIMYSERCKQDPSYALNMPE